jgi:hypothetical protein
MLLTDVGSGTAGRSGRIRDAHHLDEGLVIMTARMQNDWHRHGLRSPEDLEALVAERLEGTGHASTSTGDARREPSYADFLGEQI